MDQQKIGQLIRRLRQELNLTQKQIADKMGISDKAVSKWERGHGMPDISFLSELSELLNVDLDALMSGEVEVNQSQGGNMRKIQFYVCSECGNIITSTGEAAINCCGKKLSPLDMKKAEEQQKLKVEIIENEYYVSSNHEMKKEHYIDFVAVINGDSLILRKQYPEWDLSTRIPKLGHGQLVWHCNKHGLFYQLV